MVLVMLAISRFCDDLKPFYIPTKLPNCRVGVTNSQLLAVNISCKDILDPE